MPLADILTPIQAILAPVAEWADGAPEVFAESAPPRYVVVRTGIRIRTSTKEAKAVNALGTLLHTVKVHCWGRDETDCERLFQAFDTACHRTVTPGNYEIASCDWLDRRTTNDGVVLLAEFVFAMPRVEASIASNGVVTDKLRTYVDVTNVGFYADGGSTTTDGKLFAPDK